jgi:tetratricopeptide (TPR) repeat protein
MAAIISRTFSGWGAYGSRSTVLCVLLTAAALTVLPPAASSTESQPPDAAAGLPPLPAPQGDPETDPRMHREALDVLYGRLSAAASEDDSSLITEAIERLWLKSGSPTVDLLMERALISTRSEQYDLAIALLTRVVEVAPGYPEGWNQLAVAYYRKADYQAAVIPLQRALILEPRHYKAIEGMGVLMRELGDKPAALAAFRRALQLNPTSKAAKDAEEELTREVEGQRI